MHVYLQRGVRLGGSEEGHQLLYVALMALLQLQLLLVRHARAAAPSHLVCVAIHACICVCNICTYKYVYERNTHAEDFIM
jgi:hypothetical protein